MKRIAIISLLTIFGLAACGGGGSGSARTPTRTILPKPQQMMQKPEHLTENKQTPSLDSGPPDFTAGTPSTEKAAQDALQKLRAKGGFLYDLNRGDEETRCYYDSFARRTCRSGNFFALNDADDSIATTDTNARKAWQLGWTGKAVKVAVVDDFQTRRDENSTPHGVFTRAVVVQIAPEANIFSPHIPLPTNRDDLIVAAYTSAEKDGAHIVNSSFNQNPFRNGGKVTPSLVQRELKSASFQKVMLPALHTDSFDADMLFINSAGNHGETCNPTISDDILISSFNGPMDKCSIEGMALLKLRETEKDAGDRAIFVGALEDNTTTLASYSLSAGDLKNDFIVAHDDIYRSNDGSGTSFAAPRVTGAAALVRHKFPNLNGPQLKQVLLQSADDLGVKGVDDVFGYGRLNIMGALSPIDGLSK